MLKRVLLLSVLSSSLPAVWAQAPSTIGYQGVLTDNNGVAVPNGSYSLTFRLYAAATGGSALWSETQSVSTTSGVFNAVLGSVTPLTIAFNQPLYLGISVGSDAEMTPRIALTAAPYSLMAKGVEDGAVSSSKLADNAVSNAKIQDGAVASAKIADGTIATADLADNAVTGAKIVDGTVTAGDINSGQVVKSVNALTDAVTLAAGSNVTITPSGNTLTIAATGGSGSTLDQAYDQGGAGAGRTITADAGAVDIAGAGGLTVNGNVGIGTASPTEKLEVSGNIKLSGTLVGGSSNSVVQDLSNDVVYQNTGNRKLIVVVFANATGSAKVIEGYIDSANPPTQLVASEGGSTARISITFVVPVGWYYKVHWDNVAGIGGSAQAWEM